ncbi:uncharacterized protein K452DRAFT_117849 [Aplosporella prunicola CBS 121167]|uniref:Uncharacterized protein n=1 Tax=Aplosporella prunicola CBS 121167 TaxID=1176127 RepID=A0A6A6AXV9_9PEZI|nr:uncharacterized protein K452DRAFT_117849 [Aplosporella prunicola CBS 121167]KAF2136769.1 hypothetical protein K452DRAFT_117849 [Aplosporella prunicola CBS 121167]
MHARRHVVAARWSKGGAIVHVVHAAVRRASWHGCVVVVDDDDDRDSQTDGRPAGRRDGYENARERERERERVRWAKKKRLTLFHAPAMHRLPMAGGEIRAIIQLSHTSPLHGLLHPRPSATTRRPLIYPFPHSPLLCCPATGFLSRSPGYLPTYSLSLSFSLSRPRPSPPKHIDILLLKLHISSHPRPAPPDCDSALWPFAGKAFQDSQLSPSWGYSATCLPPVGSARPRALAPRTSLPPPTPRFLRSQEASLPRQSRIGLPSVIATSLDQLVG